LTPLLGVLPTGDVEEPVVDEPPVVPIVLVPEAVGDCVMPGPDTLPRPVAAPDPGLAPDVVMPGAVPAAPPVPCASASDEVNASANANARVQGVRAFIAKDFVMGFQGPVMCWSTTTAPMTGSFQRRR